MIGTGVHLHYEALQMRTTFLLCQIDDSSAVFQLLICNLKITKLPCIVYLLYIFVYNNSLKHVRS